MKKKSMSVREMRRLLGLGKTESYWLVKKNYFDTVIIGGKMRVMIDRTGAGGRFYSEHYLQR